MKIEVLIYYILVGLFILFLILGAVVDDDLLGVALFLAFTCVWYKYRILPYVKYEKTK